MLLVLLKDNIYHGLVVLYLVHLQLFKQCGLLNHNFKIKVQVLFIKNVFDKTYINFYNLLIIYKIIVKMRIR